MTVNPETQNKLKEYIESCGSQSAAAKKIGVSPAVLSTYLKGTYAGNVENIEKRLEEIFATMEAADDLASTNADTGYVPTSISQAVYDTIHLCHLKGGLAIECGDAGIGKTMAARQYTIEHPNTAIYIAINPCLATLSACLKLICRTLKIATGRKDDMWTRINENLSGEHKVIIIDEAQHLPVKTIEAVRAFSDQNRTLGICMIGNINTITNNGNPAYAQICNRTKLTEVRHTQQIQFHDIELLFPALPGKKEKEFILKIARSPQGIRGAKNIYSNAMDNEDITYNGLAAMAKAMMIGTI